MSWSWRLGRIAGIDVYVHATFLLILAWVGFVNWRMTGRWVDVAWGFLILFTLFGIVVLHELGHALTARRYGIRTRDITLLPIGGLARLERMPDKPVQELLVAIAGPAVNIVLAIAFGLLLWGMNLRGGLESLMEQLTPPRPSLTAFVLSVFSINIILALFNMLPAFPMDGGRVLRALLAMRLDYVQATQIAAYVGQAMAFGFGFLGIVLPNIWLVVIAVFVWLGASSEAGLAQLKAALGGIPVSRAMIREFRSLSPLDPLQRAVEYILAGFQQDFPVEQDGRLVGVLTRGRLLSALAEKGREGLVGDAMEREFETADPADMLEHAFGRLQTCNCRAIPVVRDGRVLGILTSENVGEFMMVQSALRTMPAPRVPQ
jgi:Zn-dependent protease/predicted transcriptional regulator